MHLKARNPRIFPSRRHGGGWHQRPFPESRPPPALKLAGDRRPCRPCRVPGPEPDATWDHLKRSASPLSLSLEPERRLGHRGLLAGPCKLSLLVCVDNIPLSESYSITPPTGGAPGPGPDSLWPTRTRGRAGGVCGTDGGFARFEVVYSKCGNVLESGRLCILKADAPPLLSSHRNSNIAAPWSAVPQTRLESQDRAASSAPIPACMLGATLGGGSVIRDQSSVRDG
jgi:hypothetical protein